MTDCPPVVPAVVLKNVTATRDGTVVLKDLSVTIARAQFTAVIGPNGAGKTSLLLAILGLLPISGSIQFFDADQKPHRPRIAYVPQSLSFDRQSRVTVLEFMALDMQTRPVWLGIRADVRESSRQALAQLHAERLGDRPMGRLSGGEIQRVLLAKALQRQPDLLLLDEPVSGVDIVGGHLFCDVLEKIREERKMTLVMVSHDLSVVSQHANRVICLNQSLSCEGEAPQMLTQEHLLQLYGSHSGLYEHHPLSTQKNCEHHHHGR